MIQLSDYSYTLEKGSFSTCIVQTIVVTLGDGKGTLC